MTPEDIKKQDREDSLANWRLASLLAFNGFLLAGLFAEVKTDTSQYLAQKLIPWIGLAISLSVFVVALWSAWVQLGIQDRNPELNWGPKPIRALFQFFGPYLFSTVVLVYFWVRVLCS